MSVKDIHEKIVDVWSTGSEQTLYNIIDVKTDGTVTIRKGLMETTFDPHGSEESLRKFLISYVR